MPDAVFLVDAHMTHLYRQVVLQHRLPGVPSVHFFVYPEGVGFYVAVGEQVQSGLGHFAEIKRQVLVAQKIAPRLRGGLFYQLPSLFGEAEQAHGLPGGGRRVQFYHRLFGLVGMIPYLRYLHHG